MSMRNESARPSSSEIEQPINRLTPGNRGRGRGKGVGESSVENIYGWWWGIGLCIVQKCRM